MYTAQLIAPKLVRPSLVVLGMVLVVVGLLQFSAEASRPLQPPIDLFNDVCREGSPNPWLVTACYVRGLREDDEAAIVAFRDTPNNGNHVPLATARQVGSVWGLGYHGDSEILYAAAVHKRGTHFGPAGPGGIYSINLRTGAVTTFAVVPNAGVDTHTRSTDYFPDRGGRYGSGKTSLGDLDLNEANTELYVTNLFDRRIYRYSLANAALLGSFAHGAANEPWAQDARPFGLRFHQGRLYHGVVRTAEQSRSRDELFGFVYSSLPDGSDMRQETAVALDFERGWIWPNSGRARWQPWQDPPGRITQGNAGRFPMPILADIEFSRRGNMIQGYRDRFGDTTFYTVAPTPPPPGEFYYNTAAGDILHAVPNPGGGWNTITSPEFYVDDYGPQGNRNGHEETSFGGLVMIPGHDIVATSANSPLRISSAGIIWMDNLTGQQVGGREEIYVFGSGSDDNFGKANGLGDVEVLCQPQQPTPTPTDTDTPVPTDTPTPTVTDTDTPTATDTETATPTLTPTGTLPATSTPVPASATPLPSDTLPAPSDTPVIPTQTGAPSDTPAPSLTPQPTNTSPPHPPAAATEQPKPLELPKTGGALPAPFEGLMSIGLGLVMIGAGLRAGRGGFPTRLPPAGRARRGGFQTRPAVAGSEFDARRS
jgi:hypothetical protein